MTSLSLLGLGAMGLPMSEVLLAHGQHPLTVWNRTASKAESLRQAGAAVAGTPADAAAPITLTVLPDLVDVRSVVDGPTGLRAGWQTAGIRSPLLVVMGTVSPVSVREYASELATEGIRVVDAPLSGGVIGAREARLSIMAGGSRSDIEELQPVFAVLGEIVRHMGPVGSGQLAKACNQMIVASTVSAVSEAMLLAREAGLNRSALLEILRGGLAGSEVLRQKGDNWVMESFEPGGTAAYQLKDLGFALAAASHARVDLPLTTTVRDMFAALVDSGQGGLDHTGVFRELERRSTLVPVAGEPS
ncbi:MAG TPA: NAD(P)-dependent oxidoreductase [Marisediminicola sp.]|jgi:3-hydroxyisobutyrate dehydrogenase-like beta-hydroxyacid dehydrogenase|nr:NAD(P)-dependent oxidoreductase [Marisediminicola sp.]